MDKKPGMFRYFSFGLRDEWLELFFTLGVDVLYKSSLGPKQKDALHYYLRDAEFINGRKHPTVLSERTLSIYKNEGIKSKFLWSIVWSNLCYNAPLFEWWSDCNAGTYSREKITSSLSNHHGKVNRSIRIAYQSLVGTLERTPVGKDLKQGFVQKEGRSRIVIKEGNPELSPFATLYTLYKFAGV